MLVSLTDITSITASTNKRVIQINGSLQSEIKTRHFKLPIIGLHCKLTQKKIDQLCKRSLKSLNVKLVFTSEKLRCAFSSKAPIQSEYLSKVVYKFVCASCNASYAGYASYALLTVVL